MAAHYCFYRMTHDSGFAPNPFHGWCTLAVCTPNHVPARQIGPGTVVVGVEANDLRRKRRRKNGSESTGERCIVYYMVVEEKPLTLDQYFRDPRFAAKKVDPNGSPVERVGDNVYYRDENSGMLASLPGHPHYSPNGNKVMNQDKDGNCVFVGRTFYYFGDHEIPVPNDVLHRHVPTAQGIKYCQYPLPEFDRYVESRARGRSGMIGDPIDMDVSNHSHPRGCGCG